MKHAKRQVGHRPHDPFETPEQRKAKSAAVKARVEAAPPEYKAALVQQQKEFLGTAGEAGDGAAALNESSDT
jgi:hypothetical protein